MIPSEDFSFPTVTEPIPKFASSPSLWRVHSDDVFEDCLGSERGEEEMKKVNDDDDDDDDEEKMDKLWENFNHEEVRDKDDHHIGRLFDSEDMVEFCCVQALKMSKTSSTMLSPRKQPSLLVMLKVLKKLFLLQHSHAPHRRSSSSI